MTGFKANYTTGSVSEYLIYYFEVENFFAFQALYGIEFANTITSTILEELQAHISVCSRNGHVVTDMLEPGKIIVLCRRCGSSVQTIADHTLNLRLAIRSRIKTVAMDHIGKGIDILAGYSILNDNVSLESALYTALYDARRTAVGLLNEGTLSLLTEFRSIVTNCTITSLYQPIVDMLTGEIHAWEALTRGPANSDLYSPDALFDFAEDVGEVYSLESTCRQSAICNYGPADKDQKLFLNIHPRTLVDPNFSPGETLGLIQKHGLSPRNIVFEITERHAISDFTLFHRTLEYYRSQGYLVAVDDVGTGYSGLTSIADIRPDYIKIDMKFIRDIDSDPVKRALLETFATFGEKIGSKIIAEGIETHAEMTTLMLTGAHYGQGYLLARPATPKPQVNPALTFNLGNQVKTADKMSIPIAELAEPARVISPDTQVKDVQEMFSGSTPISAIIVAKNSIPQGLVMSHHFHKCLSTNYGMSLYAHRSVQCIMDTNALIVEGDSSVETVARRAMNRNTSNIYDHIIVTSKGSLLGIVSVQQLLDTLAQVQIRVAKGANPLSGLPGNLSIEKEIERRSCMGQPFSIVYADLDNFKAYNDTYGFQNGDEVILLLVRILKWALKRYGSDTDFAGHVGGDDFVLLTAPENVERICRGITRVFGRLVRYNYNDEDRTKGFIIANGRDGVEYTFPLVSVSLAILDANGVCDPSIIAVRAAEMKKYAKQRVGNSYVRDRRAPLGSISTPDSEALETNCFQ